MSKLRAIRNWSKVSGLAGFWWSSEFLALPFDRKRRVPPWAMHNWCRTTADALGIQRKLHGAEYLEQVGQCVMIANHQSLLDILVIGSFIDRDYRWLAKASLFKYPFVGWHLGMAGHVRVYRGKDKQKNREMPERIHAAIEEGASLLFFPEGTRSKDQTLQPFRRGAFVAAIDENLPVLPLVVRGTGQLMRKGARDLAIEADRTCSVTILPPIFPPARGETAARVDQLRDAAFEAVRKEYERA